MIDEQKNNQAFEKGRKTIKDEKTKQCLFNPKSVNIISPTLESGSTSCNQSKEKLI